MCNLVSLETSWYQSLKHNWGDYLKNVKRKHPCWLPYLKWFIHNQQHQWKLKTQRQISSLMEQQQNIHSNRHVILLGTLHNMKISFPRILGRSKEKPGGSCHKTPTDTAPQNYAINKFETNKKRYRNIKRPANWNQKRVCWNYQSQGNPETG